MTTATAPHFGPDRSRAAKLAPSRGAAAPAQSRPTKLTNPAPSAARHDANGDVVGIFGGSGILLIQVSAVIPGLLPCLLLAGVLALPLVLPVLALGLVAGILVGLPLGLWRLVRRLIGPDT